tara:strand:- start:851 stop:1264 length:414 start_codon:yes stop_codon:yes gene_type:complete
LALYVWCSYFGWQDSLFPENVSAKGYEATSPTLGKRIWFSGIKDINDEVGRVIEEGLQKNFSIGQALYYSLPFFCNAKIFAKQIYRNLLEEYQIVQDFKVPLAENLDKVPVIKARYFSVIRQELLNCQQRQMDMNNG